MTKKTKEKTKSATGSGTTLWDSLEAKVKARGIINLGKVALKDTQEKAQKMGLDARKMPDGTVEIFLPTN